MGGEGRDLQEGLIGVQGVVFHPSLGLKSSAGSPRSAGAHSSSVRASWTSPEPPEGRQVALFLDVVKDLDVKVSVDTLNVVGATWDGYRWNRAE